MLIAPITPTSVVARVRSAVFGTSVRHIFVVVFFMWRVLCETFRWIRFGGRGRRRRESCVRLFYDAIVSFLLFLLFSVVRSIAAGGRCSL